MTRMPHECECSPEICPVCHPPRSLRVALYDEAKRRGIGFEQMLSLIEPDLPAEQEREGPGGAA